MTGGTVGAGPGTRGAARAADRRGELGGGRHAGTLRGERRAPCAWRRSAFSSPTIPSDCASVAAEQCRVTHLDPRCAGGRGGGWSRRRLIAQPGPIDRARRALETVAGVVAAAEDRRWRRRARSWRRLARPAAGRRQERLREARLDPGEAAPWRGHLGLRGAERGVEPLRRSSARRTTTGPRSALRSRSVATPTPWRRWRGRIAGGRVGRPALAGSPARPAHRSGGSGRADALDATGPGLRAVATSSHTRPERR